MKATVTFVGPPGCKLPDSTWCTIDEDAVVGDRYRFWSAIGLERIPGEIKKIKRSPRGRLPIQMEVQPLWTMN